MSDNPFDTLQLDPRHTPQELTELLRRRAERASPAERSEIQNLWRQLTLKESDRIRWALLAHPRSTRHESDQIQDLQDKIPPFLSRYTPPELHVTLRDLILTPEPLKTNSNEDQALFKPPLYSSGCHDKK